jgi:hypothetical protein
MTAFLRRNAGALAITAVMAGLFANAWWQTSGAVMLLLALAAIGLSIAVLFVMWAQGSAVVRHSRQTAKAIEAAQGRKEIAS